mgnify:CR=1 FL=1
MVSLQKRASGGHTLAFLLSFFFAKGLYSSSLPSDSSEGEASSSLSLGASMEDSLFLTLFTFFDDFFFFFFKETGLSGLRGSSASSERSELQQEGYYIDIIS